MKPNYAKEAVASTPQFILSKPKPIIIGKHKYSGVWFDHITKKEFGIKIGSNVQTETGRKFKCVETRMVSQHELVDCSKYKNKKIYVSYPDSTEKCKAEIWMLVE
jgi:hypothetical protein